MSGTEKYLITGYSGFVSQHFIEYLERQRIPSQVLGVDVNEPAFSTGHFQYVKCEFRKADLLNRQDVERIISSFQPNYILHLASYSSVAMSWKMPVESFANNTNIFLNLVETVRQSGVPCRILSIGSSEEYGSMESG